MQLSAPCRIVEMTAEVLGLEYEFKVVNLMEGEHMKPEFLAMNPQHNIPTVKDGDFVMNESRAAAAYLVNKYGKDDSLYPKDAETRARVDQRLYFDMGVFYKVYIMNANSWHDSERSVYCNHVHADCSHLPVASNMALFATCVQFQHYFHTIIRHCLSCWSGN